MHLTILPLPRTHLTTPSLCKTPPLPPYVLKPPARTLVVPLPILAVKPKAGPCVGVESLPRLLTPSSLPPSPSAFSSSLALAQTDALSWVASQTVWGSEQGLGCRDNVWKLRAVFSIPRSSVHLDPLSTSSSTWNQDRQA